MKKSFFIFIIMISLLVSCERAYPKDFGFSLILKFEASLTYNEINTFENYVIKDLVLDGIAKTEMILTKEEMKSIYDQMMAVEILSYPRFFNPPIDSQYTPSPTYIFVIVIDGKEKEIYWTDSGMSQDEKAIRLRELIKSILSLVREKDEYRQLPPANGGYI